MAKTAADLLVEKLIAWNVEVVFGLPGDGINGIMEALRTHQDRVRFVQVRHEEAAAFMACGYAKYTGRLGVCLATSGPGAVHLLNGLYDAKLDGQPVLAITGQTYHDLLGTSYQQEVDLVALFRDVAVYNQLMVGARQVPHLVDIAVRTALARRGVAHLCWPVDLQGELAKDDWTEGEHRIEGFTRAGWTPNVELPTEPDLRAAAQVLARGSKTVILAGRGALGCRDELEQLADRLAAPIVKALLGKACVPDDSPFTTGGIGLLGTEPSEVALEQCDTLLMVGTAFPYTEFYPTPGAAKAVQIDRDATRIGLRYPIDVGLSGDARATLRALLPMLDRRADRGFLAQAQQGMVAWRELLQARAARDDAPLKPQRVARAIGAALADDAIVSTDSGTNTTWAARYIDMKPGMMFSCSGNLATMAPGLPYALAAQLAYPGRQCVAFVGDGGFTMLMGEMATAVKYGLPVKVCIVKNNTLGQIKWEQMVFLGNPEYGVELQPIDFVKFAEAVGVAGFRVDAAADVNATVDAWLRCPGPAILEAVVDPNEPPMPARIKPRQALHMAEALARGEPNPVRLGLTLFRDKLGDYTKK